MTEYADLKSKEARNKALQEAIELVKDERMLFTEQIISALEKLKL